MSVLSQRDVYEWIDPFEAIRREEQLSARDYDYDYEVSEMRHLMRERYDAENAYLRRQVEGLLKTITDLAANQPLPPPIMFIGADPRTPA